jgi:ATP-dependent exoDNAse (exonuclease V) beta subunit
MIYQGTLDFDPDNSARQRIRESLDETLIVEAAAGAGKTSELIRRIVGILRTGRTTVDRIVAVTFTRKAAGELRLRLRIELDAARIAAADVKERTRLENALSRLEEAHIGTIHSFCAEILRQRPVEARIAPGFQEIDEEQAERLYGRAFDAWIQRNLQSMPTGLRRTLNRASIEPAKEGDGPLDRLRSAGWMLVNWRDFRQPWRREAFDRSSEIAQRIAEIDELGRVASECTSLNHPVRKHLQCVIDFVARLRRSQQVGRLDSEELEAQLVRLAGDVAKRHDKGQRQFSKTHSRDAVLDLKDRLVASLADFKRQANADLASLLQSEMQDLIDLYEEMKSRSGKLDFVDLLSRTRDLIKENVEVRGFLQHRFTHIFLDEFQDTDPVQAEILVLLSTDDPNQTEWRRVRPKPGKLFLVGDPKQSIYRFRRADIIFYQDLCARLSAQGVVTLNLTRSFRAVRPIQDAVNVAFAPEMQNSKDAGQSAYVPLEEFRTGSEFPSLVALPVPYPYGYRDVTKTAIDASLPDAIAAFVQWLIRDSGWKVQDPDSKEWTPIASEHVAILFRRFTSFGSDVARAYVHALEARNIPHQLWQARSFHQREEVETVRAALNAIEWPDDELSVFATLKGSLFAISDALLLRFRHDVGSFHPFRPLPEVLHADFVPVKEALGVLADLHRRRNWRSVVETVNSLLDAVRAHAGFALRPSGNQVLANVYHVCNLARIYEAHGGYSFRGFVEQLNDASEREDSGEAPIVEEGAEGVRIVTVHAAKGLEFPVVILADITANSAQREADKHIDNERNICALRLMGCSPWELIDHQEQEHNRDLAEGVRIAYVAATRARDLLVVPVVGDKPFENGWVAALNKAVYPARSEYRNPRPAPQCPSFGDATVLGRPMEYDGALETSVRPGLHRCEGSKHSVVWWDPGLLDLKVEANFGLRQKEILAEVGDESERALIQYQSWKSRRNESIELGRTPSLSIFAATDGLEPPHGYSSRAQVERVARVEGRPQGARFGTLVHLIFRDVGFTAKFESILKIAQAHARPLNAPAEEIDAAANAVLGALRHPLLERARHAKQVHRELPILIHDDIGGVLDAVIDLAFLEESIWTIVDFKTDVEDPDRLTRYRRQLGWYIHSMEKATGAPARGFLLHV